MRSKNTSSLVWRRFSAMMTRTCGEVCAILRIVSTSTGLRSGSVACIAYGALVHGDEPAVGIVGAVCCDHNINLFAVRTRRWIYGQRIWKLRFPIQLSELGRTLQGRFAQFKISLNNLVRLWEISQDNVRRMYGLCQSEANLGV